MRYQYASNTNIGQRDNNEDSLGVKSLDGTLLAVVADGLGGHANGEVASRIAVDTLLDGLAGKHMDEDELAFAILNASERICAADISGHTTVASLWLEAGCGVAAHVGDSRIYQFRNGKIIFQSVDHSMVQMAIAVGELDASAARHHKDRNKLFRVLGDHHDTPRIDSTELTVLPGDRFLLCSDGFWEPVTETDMCRTALETASPDQWLEAMTRIIAQAADPKQDNHSAVCVLVK